MSSNKSQLSSLQLSSAEMREVGYRIIDILVHHFDQRANRSVTGISPRVHLEEKLRETVPEEPSSLDEILNQLQQHVFSNMMHPDHPRFFAFVPSPSNFISVMADALISGFNVFAGTWLEASGAAMIELVTIDWLARLCELPETAGGLFVSGGSMANLTALAVARTLKLQEQQPNATVYFSDQTHSSVERALRVIGFSSSQFRKILSDTHFRLEPKVLREQIASDRKMGMLPFCIIANAGTTNTGAVDPLRELSEICRGEGLWFHIDGAYGAAAMLSARGKKHLDGLSEADSLSLDPHKWMFQPFEMGCVLVRDVLLLKKVFHILPEYMQDADRPHEEINFCDYGVQLTRSFRALKLWMSIKYFGVEAFRQAVTRGFELAEFAQAQIENMPPWELMTPATMGILTFRYHPAGASAQSLDDLNRQIIERLSSDGFAFLSSTVLNGKTVLRLCCINPRTTEGDILQTLQRLRALASLPA